MQAIQFIQISPEQLQTSIIDGVKEQLKDLKQNFQLKEPTTYLTRQEVAEMFKIDISTVHNWTKRGKIKSYGIGGRVYYKRQELEASIVELKQ